MIRIKNVNKYFGSNQALKNINLHVKQGEIFGIIGESGAGKSTLIRMINFLEQPTEGEITVDNQTLNYLSNKELLQIRKNIGMIFQHFNLLQQKNVFDNIALSLKLANYSKDQIKTKVQNLLKIVDLENKAYSYPKELSGGQKQRVAIARAIATNPKILLCDEATSALDPNTTIKILELLKKINKQFNITILLITHEMDVIKKLCDKVAVIDKGILIEQGNVSDIFAQPIQQRTKDLINTTINLDIPENYIQSFKSEGFPVVCLYFTGQSTDEPLISIISIKFNVQCKLICAQMDCINGVKFGNAICEINGEESNIQKAFEYLKENKVRLEIKGYV